MASLRYYDIMMHLKILLQILMIQIFQMISTQYFMLWIYGFTCCMASNKNFYYINEVSVLSQEQGLPHILVVCIFITPPWQKPSYEYQEHFFALVEAGGETAFFFILANNL